MAREMKDSGIDWIGRIPNSWSIVKNKYILETMYSGGTPTSSNENYYSDDGIPFVSISDMSTAKYVTDTKKKLTEEGLKDKNLVILPKGTILYSIYATIGAVSELRIPATISQAMLALNLKQTFNKRYYKYNLQAMRDYIFFSANGNTQFNLNAEKVWNFFFVDPEINEQERIANFLDTECSRIDSVIEQTRTSIEEYKMLKQAVITQAVTKGIRPNREMKNSGIACIGKIPNNWTVKRVKYIANSLSKGNGITKEEVHEDGDIQCVRYGEIYSKYERDVIDTFSLTNLEEINNPRFISYGDILFAGTGELVEEIGKNIVYLGRKDCLAGGDIIVMKHSQNPIFLNYALGSAYSQNQKSMGKAKLKVVHISSTEIGDIRIALPSLSEQNEIVLYLNEKIQIIDDLIKRKEYLITELGTYKKSLIFEYVTGKKEVPA